MTDRDRLAADLHDAICNYHWPELLTCGIDHADDADRLIAAGWTRQEACDPPCGDCCVEHPHWTHYHIVTDPGAAQMAEWLATWEKGSNSVRATDLHGLVTDPAWAEGHRRGEALDEERLARALHHMAFGGGSDGVPATYEYDVGFLTYSGEATSASLAAAIAKAYREDTDATN